MEKKAGKLKNKEAEKLPFLFGVKMIKAKLIDRKTNKYEIKIDNRKIFSGTSEEASIFMIAFSQGYNYFTERGITNYKKRRF